mmetsp:Transcript_2934/g.6104  ORF Transcript_2934/g.6104 Transcript_2934/m.6104 type:complete len:355 (-) Transcript_2934:32-1096(-)
MEGGSFRAEIRKRLLEDMLGAVHEASKQWSVLVVDELTVRILSKACTMTELMEAGVSLVEHLHIKRQPMPNASVIYFIRPTQKSVNQLIEDFASEKKPMYQCASVFFCSKIRPALLTSIKSAPKVLERLVDLKEVNVEVLALEPRVFVTENTDALRVLYGKNAAQSLRFEMTIESIATRLATVFASLNEFPSIRFAAPKASSGTQPTTDTEAARSRLAQQVAQRVHAQLSTLQSQSASIPAHATCDLLVVDRTLDLVAPVVHELTYEAMCYDLLPHEGDSFSYATTTQVGRGGEGSVGGRGAQLPGDGSYDLCRVFPRTQLGCLTPGSPSLAPGSASLTPGSASLAPGSASLTP